MKWLKYLLIVLLLAAVGCQIPTRAYPSFSIQMSTPETSTYIMIVGDTLNLVARGVDRPDTQATGMIFYANGRSIGTSPITRFSSPSDITRVTGSVYWTPTTPGEYYVQAELDRGSGASAMAPAVRVCVFDVHLGAQVYLRGNGYSGPCTIPPAPTVPRGTSTAVSIHATADPVSLAYMNDSCPGPIAPITTFTATVNDPSGRVAFVSVRVSSTSPFYDDVIVLAQSAGGPTGLRTYTGSYGDGLVDVDLNHIFHGGPGTLSWQARALDRSGTLVAHEEHTMLVGPCEPPVHPLTSATDTPTPGILTILPTPTFTPASAADCPSGTYFADVTHKCIPIVTPTTGSGGVVFCGKITSDSVCNSTPGCTFDYGAKVCKKK